MQRRNKGQKRDRDKEMLEWYRFKNHAILEPPTLTVQVNKPKR